jgi:hypothetical protein
LRRRYFTCSTDSSAFGTRTRRCARLINRSFALAPSGIGFASSSPRFSVRFRLCSILPDQLHIGQPLSGNRRYHLSEPTAVVVFAFVEPEGLFVEIPIKMDWVNADVGSLKGAFQKAPEILDVVSVDVVAHKLDRVVNGFMSVVSGKAEIGLQGVRVDVGAGLDSRREPGGPVSCGEHSEHAWS